LNPPERAKTCESEKNKFVSSKSKNSGFKKPVKPFQDGKPVDPFLKSKTQSIWIKKNPVNVRLGQLNNAASNDRRRHCVRVV
jgi:hypothetical protein